MIIPKHGNKICHLLSVPLAIGRIQVYAAVHSRRPTWKSVLRRFLHPLCYHLQTVIYIHILIRTAFPTFRQIAVRLHQSDLSSRASQIDKYEFLVNYEYCGTFFCFTMIHFFWSPVTFWLFSILLHERTMSLQATQSTKKDNIGKTTILECC